MPPATPQTDDADPLPALPDHVPQRVRRALAEAKERLRATYGDRLRRVVLYGSYARGDATPDSDVDVLVVLDRLAENSYDEIKRTTDVQIPLFEQYRLHFSLKPYTESSYRDRRRSFVRNVHADGIEL
jgi:predicted nucleotidyltransferase